MTLSPRQWVIVCVGVIMIPVSPALANGPLSSDGDPAEHSTSGDVEEHSTLALISGDALKKDRCAKAISDAFRILGSKKKISYHADKDALVYDDEGDLAIYTENGKKIFKPDQMLCEETQNIANMNDAFSDAIGKIKDEWDEKIKDPSVHVGNLSGQIETLQLEQKCEGIAQAQTALTEFQNVVAQALREPRNVASQGSSGSAEDTPANSVLGTD